MATITGFLDLPAELILHTSSFLTTREFGSLRLSCKHVGDILYKPFSREFFTRRQFMFEFESLDTLVNIANSRMANCVKEVIFGTDRLRSLGAGEVETDENGLRRAPILHSTLMSTGLGRDMVESAFSNLPNLKAVGIRDYHSVGRWRDGELSRWRSYGWSTGMNDDVRQQIVLGQSNDATHPSSDHTILSVVLYALAKANNTQLEAIDVILRRYPLPDRAFMIIGGPLESKIVPILARLKRLNLRVDKHSSTSQRTGHVPAGSVEQFYHLRRFLSATTNLQHLRLNFNDSNEYHSYEDLGEFLEWFSGSALGHSSLSHDLHLTTLEIGCVRTTVPILSRIISRFHLNHLSLFKIDIDCASQAQFDDEMEPDVLTNLLMVLSKLPTIAQLETVLIAHISQTVPSVVVRTDSRKLRFGTVDTTDDDREANYPEAEEAIKFNKKRDGSARLWLERAAKRVVYVRKHDVATELHEDVSLSELGSDSEVSDESEE